MIEFLAAFSDKRVGFDILNKYFTLSSMPVVSSQYWNQVHGNTPAEVLQDEEGLQTMRVLGNNMAFLIKSIALGKEQFGIHLRAGSGRFPDGCWPCAVRRSVY